VPLGWPERSITFLSQQVIVKSADAVGSSNVPDIFLLHVRGSAARAVREPPNYIRATAPNKSHAEPWHRLPGPCLFFCFLPGIMPLPARRVGTAHHRVRSNPSEPQILDNHWDFSMVGSAHPTRPRVSYSYSLSYSKRPGSRKCAQSRITLMKNVQTPVVAAQHWLRVASATLHPRYTANTRTPVGFHHDPPTGTGGLFPNNYLTFSLCPPNNRILNYNRLTIGF
jgi:hypothetical protein